MKYEIGELLRKELSSELSIELSPELNSKLEDVFIEVASNDVAIDFLCCECEYKKEYGYQH